MSNGEMDSSPCEVFIILFVIFNWGDDGNIAAGVSSSEESFDSRCGFVDKDKDKDFDNRILSSMDDVWLSFDVDDSVPRRTY